jgi:Rap1a immunity proteins
MKALPAILALLVVSTIVPASAEHGQLTVGNLQEICTRSDNGSKEACQYYILGVMEGTRMAAAFAGGKTHFCIPEGVSLVAVEALIKNEIEEDLTVYPADRDLAAVGSVTAAAQKTYPCRDSN